MEKLWTDDAWSEYLYWQEHDKKTLKCINALVKDIERNGVDSGIGKPERLKYQPLLLEQNLIPQGGAGNESFDFVTSPFHFEITLNNVPISMGGSVAQSAYSK